MPTVLLATFFVTGSTDSAESKRLAPSLRTIGEAHEQNRESFQHFVCIYWFRSGIAHTMQDALEGKLTDATVSKATWVKDGKSERCTLIVDAKTQRITRQESADGRQVVMVAPIMDKQFLASDEFSTNASPGNASLFPISDGMANPISNPFQPGMFDWDYRRSPGAVIRTHSPINFRILPARPDGMIVVEWTMATETQQYGKTEYHFDPNRGFALRRLDRNGDGSRTLLVVPSVQECSGGRWFPMRVLRINPNGPIFAVWDFEVETLKVDPPRRELDLTIELEAGSQVNQGGRPGGWFKLKEPQKIQPKDLRTLWDLCNEMRVEREAAVEPRNSSRKFWFIAIGVVLLIVSGWLLWPRIRGTN